MTKVLRPKPPGKRIAGSQTWRFGRCFFRFKWVILQVPSDFFLGVASKQCCYENFHVHKICSRHTCSWTKSGESVEHFANKPLMMCFLTISDADVFLQQFVNDKLSHCSCQGSQLLLGFWGEGFGDVKILARKQWRFTQSHVYGICLQKDENADVPLPCKKKYALAKRELF